MLVVLLVRDVTQDVLQPVFDAALALGGRELDLTSLQHGRVAIRNPRVYRLNPTLLDVLQGHLPAVTSSSKIATSATCTAWRSFSWSSSWNSA